MRKQFAEEPLLFINQPTRQRPEAPMQHNFFTPKKEDVKQKDNNIEKKKSPSRPYKRTYFEEESKHLERKAQEEIESMETEEKKFTNRTIEEKVSYFIDAPAHIPKLRCEIITEDNKYRGIITDYKDGAVFIRGGRRSTSDKVSFAEIKDIRMLGF